MQADGHPITVYLVTALILWGIYLWRQGRLGQVQMLPHPKQVVAPLIGPPAPLIGPVQPLTPPKAVMPHLEPAPPSGPGWQQMPGVMQ